MRHFLIFFIYLYRHTLGLLLPRVCRFEPTCSQYAIDALKEHGVCRGIVLSAWRVVRCNPLSDGGWDPVPQAHSHAEHIDQTKVGNSE
jgi:putative membrane protein insertion efficiency factor